MSLQLADVEIFQNLKYFRQWFCSRVSKQLGKPIANSGANAERLGEKPIADLWDNHLGSKSNATDYFEDVILAKCDRPLVIAIDELSQLFAYPNIASEFLSLLRAWSEQAKESMTKSNPWYNLRLVTVHSTEIQMPVSLNQSLLNAGLLIELPEFTPDQVQELAERWGVSITEQLITLLGGHPYRLQLAFYHLQQQTITLEQLLQDSAIAIALYADHLQQQWCGLQLYPKLWPFFWQIIRQPNPVDCQAEEANLLHQMGLVHLQGLQASLACELFRPFFCDRLPQLNS